MIDVWLELANEESADTAQGKETLHNVSAGKWLAMGLDLEEQQYVGYTAFIVHLLTLFAGGFLSGKHPRRSQHLVPPTSKKSDIYSVVESIIGVRYNVPICLVLTNYLP